MRAYVRALQLVFFFRLHPFTRPPQVTRYQRTMGEDFAIFSFTSFFYKRQNRKRRKNNCYFIKTKARQPPFLLRSTDGEGKCQKPSPETLYCTNSYRHSVKE